MPLHHPMLVSLGLICLPRSVGQSEARRESARPSGPKVFMAHQARAAELDPNVINLHDVFVDFKDIASEISSFRGQQYALAGPGACQ